MFLKQTVKQTVDIVCSAYLVGYDFSIMERVCYKVSNNNSKERFILKNDSLQVMGSGMDTVLSQLSNVVFRDLDPVTAYKYICGALVMAAVNEPTCGGALTVWTLHPNCPPIKDSSILIDRMITHQFPTLNKDKHLLFFSNCSHLFINYSVLQDHFENDYGHPLECAPSCLGYISKNWTCFVAMMVEKIWKRDLKDDYFGRCSAFDSHDPKRVRFVNLPNCGIKSTNVLVMEATYDNLRDFVLMVCWSRLGFRML